MKLKYLLPILLILLSSCGAKQNVDNIQKKSKIEEHKILNKHENKKTNDVKKDKLSVFDEEIIKIAIKKGLKICENMGDKKDICIKIVKEEQIKLDNLRCLELRFSQKECFDKKYFKNLECENINDVALKRQCYIQKEYLEAIKNKDKSSCNKLPRTIRTECLNKIK